MDHHGHVFVVNQGNHRIDRFTGHGEFQQAFGTRIHPRDFVPADVAAGQGHVFVLDEVNSRIDKFTSEGLFLHAWGTSVSGSDEFSHPTDIAVGPQERVYVADDVNNRIEEFSQP